MRFQAMGWRSLAAALALAVCAGCSSGERPGGGAGGCTNNLDCVAGSSCVDGFCVASETPADAGSEASDAGTGDADGGDGGTVNDTTAPTLKIDWPEADAVLSTEVAVKVTASDDASGVSKVEASINGLAWTALTLDGGAWEGTLPLPLEDNVTRTLTVRAIDGANNQAEASIEFVNDGVAPVLTLTEPALTLVNRTHLGSVLEFTGTATDGAGVVETEYSLDQVDWVPVSSPTDFSVKFAIPDQTEESLVLYFRATDGNGNVTSPVLETSPIRIDTVAPTWTFTSPAEGQVFTLADPAGASIEGSSSAGDIASVELLIDGSSKLKVQTGTLSYALQLAAEDNVAHQIEVRVVDTAGNPLTVTRSYTVDRVPPNVAITIPAQDYDCSGPQCLYAAVSLDFPNLAIAGTASDGAGLAATGGMDVAIGSYASGAVSVTGNGNWSYLWEELPTPNGEEVLVTATATDANGNSASAVRRLWVDRVAPKATKLVEGGRRVVRTEPLISFDEPMDVSSVKASSTFFLAGTAMVVPVTSFDSADGRTFRLGNGNELGLYSAYSLYVGTNAMDKSGNRLEADTIQKFRTEGAYTGATATIATRGEKPLLFVDPDGNPVVFHRNLVSNHRIAAARWNGTSAYELTYLDNNVGPDTCERGFSGTLTTSVEDWNLQMLYDANVLYCEMNGSTGTIYRVRSTPTLGFNNTQAERQFIPNDPRVPGGSNPVFEMARLLSGPLTLVSVPRARYLDGSGNLLESFLNTATDFWNTPTTYMAGAADAMLSESAFAHSGKLFYSPTKTEVASLPAGESFTAISGHGTSDWGGTGPGHLLWATQNGGTFSLRAACAGQPAQAANWKHASALGFTTTSRIERVEVRVMHGRVLYALQTATDQVHFASHADAACAAAPPSLTWSRVTVPARRPSIALDRNARTGAEKVMVAYEEPVSGAVKLYMP